ncbi:DEAD/DEAH box helicase [Roseospira marina]|uniref:DEAD/DEAH box helicase n=1 Tax=Roseospira marina TaxID=140057 RepID=A0A5M6IAX2_9PROT|nr:DEAD/DEAH box helicase [Roseospira marina]KAA5605444.1 DEAD/DEAH box helicase [Roseospira marina]MBB4314560.1 superfamily II DNA or RNA helicase [Roseospira marina]MBB5088878.1 superfamily II DNA or RNA helicase [Roseospira marina]
MTTLRPYQNTSVAAILAYLQRGESPLYALPTGGGKTVVAGSVLQTVAAPDHGWRVLWLAHRRELIRQASKALRVAGIDHGIIAPDHRFDGTDRVAIASVDTLPRRVDALAPWLDGVRLVVADECHHAVSPKWQRAMAACPSAQRLGLTATPYRLDGQGLGHIFSAAVRGPSIRALIDDGYLVEPNVYMPRTDLDLGGLKRRFGDWKTGDLVNRVDRPDITRVALRWYSARLAGTPTVVFCASIEHATHVAEAFGAAGWRAAVVHGGTPEAERDAIFANLATGRLQIVCNVEIITEGVDVPRIGGVILLRPTQSTALYLQMIGRALRLLEGKAFTPIIDIARCSAIHGLPDEDRPWRLDTGLANGRLQQLVEATRVCPKCARVHRRVDPACPGCGYRVPQVPKPVATATRDGDRPSGFPGLTVQQVRDMPYGRLLTLGTDKAALIRIASIRGYKLGWVSRILDERRRTSAPVQRATGARRWRRATG